MTLIQCDAILFDLDGVLIDSTACIIRHWQRWAQKHNLNLANILQVSHGRRTVETMRLVAPHIAVEMEAKQFAAAEAIDTEDVFAITGAASLLQSLPIDAWAIVTSGTNNVATGRLNHTGLPMPTVLVTAEDVSHGKPHPEPYLVAAQKMNISRDRCVVVEDAPAGIEAAHLAGMQTIAITTTHARDAFAKAQVIVEHLSELKITNNRNGYRLAIEIG